MKNFKVPFILLSLLFVLSACKNPCKDITCENGGTCNDGTCVCLDGFKGANCETIDLCYNVNCWTNSTCKEGVCTCNVGYEGTQCEVRSSYKFIGNYIANESCLISGDNTYNLSISHSASDPVKLYFRYLFKFADDVYANLNANGTSFTIPEQTVLATGTLGNLTISGSGSRSANGNISLNYVVQGNSCANTMVWQ